MGKEIERKFLVRDESYRQMASDVVEIKQGYISMRPAGTVRVRLKGNDAYLTVKGLNDGAVRDEWEYRISVEDARQMLERVTEGTVISKKRYMVNYEGHTWEVDEFAGDLAGLVVAEVELKSIDEPVPMPDFIGEEVTGDSRYYNSTLAAIS